MDPFATLGLTPRFDLSTEELEARWREMQRALHPDRHTDKPPAERRISLAKAVEVNEAYRALRDDLSRAIALLALRGFELKEGQDAAKPDPAFLMEVMELREGLSEARQARDLERARALGQEVGQAQSATRAKVAQLFGSDAAPEQIAAQVSRMRYYRRFLDELEVIEEEALS